MTGKLRAVIDSEATGIWTIPVPVRETDWGELAALSVKVSVAESAPAAVGLKKTVMVQDAPTLMVPQLLVWTKEEGFEPPVTILERTKAAPPVFLRVMDWVAEEAPTAVVGKVRLAGEKLAVGAATAVPESVRDLAV